ncbi:hypothetical protein Syn8016DRAFT_2134, partial [Synechococcus sp. WH 8016]
MSSILFYRCQHIARACRLVFAFFDGFDRCWKTERPPLPDGRDGLARSFMHIANQYPVNLYRRSVNLETTTVN